MQALHQSSSATPTPERGVEGMFSQETDRVAAIAGLSKLSSATLGTDDVEVRVWFGFGLFPSQGLVIIRNDDRWSAIHLMADRHYEPEKVSRKQRQDPKSGWETFWQQLVGAGVLTLPDGTEVAPQLKASVGPLR